MSQTRYEVFKDAKGGFRFRLVAANNKTILASESYTTRQGCNNGIASCQQNAVKDERYKRLEAKNGQPYFNLTAANHQVIGTSEMYETVAGREAGIAAVKKDGPTQRVDDQC